MLALVLNVICTINESFWIMHYADLLLERHSRWSRFWYLTGIVGNVLLVLGLNQIVLVSPYTAVISMVFIMLAICIGYKTDFLTAMALTGPYFLMILLKGVIEVTVAGSVGGDDLLQLILEEKGWERCVFLCIGGGFWFSLNFLISKQIEKREWKKNARFFAIVSLLGVIGTTFLWH